MDPLIERFDARLAQGITLCCRAAGSVAAPKVLLLHGFPEAAFVWDEVMQSLAGKARCIAPNMRGYEHSSAPADVAAYRVKHLAADIEALIAQLGGAIDLLVAHDWGGAVAWTLAAQKPHLMKHLLIVNSPHPAAFLRELRDNPRQQAASAYMNFLCRPDAEALLAQDDFARLWPFFINMGGAAWLTDDLRARYREVWSLGLSGAINFYRASPLRPARDGADPVASLQLDDGMLRCCVPTTVLWGDADTALLPGLLDGLEHWVPLLHLVRVPAATHWIVHEQPSRVVAEIELALASLSG